jgi:hypothetical protein
MCTVSNSVHSTDASVTLLNPTVYLEGHQCPVYLMPHFACAEQNCNKVQYFNNILCRFTKCKQCPEEHAGLYRKVAQIIRWLRV